ncbi:MAG: CBS domain-containing protein [Spirulina sp. SIO3F2]|nr:CBS domain-containing protein [Spirulina sp. SIO3F2]
MTKVSPAPSIYLPALADILDNRLLAVPPTTPLVHVLEQLTQFSRQLCPVGAEQQDVSRETNHCAIAVDEHQRPLGIITERDVVRWIAEGQSLAGRTLQELMTPNPIRLQTNDYTDIFAVIELMQRQQIRHLPVVDVAGRLQGVVTPESLRWVLQPVNLLRMRLLSEVMNSAVVTASPEVTVLQLAQQMAQAQISCVVIINALADGVKPLGIVTEWDILQYQTLALNLASLPAHQVMSSPLLTLQPSHTLWDAHQLMQAKRIRRVVITDAQQRLQGIVTQTSILQPLCSADLYSIVQVLQQKITHLESEKRAILEQRTSELEQQVAQRTQALQAQTQRSQEASQRERLLTEIARNIRQSLDLPQILATTVQEVRSLLAVDRVFVLQFDPDWQGQVVAESVGSHGRKLLGETIHDPCFAPDWIDPYLQGRIRVVDDIYQAQMTNCHIELLEALQIRAKILVPIVLPTPTVELDQPQLKLWGLLCANQCNAARAWQPFEMDLLERLAIQVAIAIQQSQLYQQSQTELAERQRAETALRNLVKGTAAVTGEDFFPALVKHLATALGVRGAIVSSWTHETLEILGCWIDNGCFEPSSDKAPDSPHLQTLKQQYFCCPAQLALHHPQFSAAYPFRIESYLGVSLLNSRKQPIGTLCVLDDQVIYHPERTEAILRVFAARAAAELERQWALERLQNLNQTLESWVIKRTSALQQSLKALSDIKYALDQTAIIAITDVEGVITDVNDKFCEISEYSREELLGQTHRLINSGHHSTEFFATLWQTIQAGQVWHGEIKNRAKSGRYYWVSTTIVPFFNEQGEIFQYLAIRLDITEQKNAESAIIQLLKKERELSELKSRFVTMASHEFRTPLSLISSSTGILQDYGDRLSTPKKQKHLDRIQGAVKQITQLIEDVLTFNHAASAQLPFKPVVLDLIEFCTALWVEFQQRYPERQIVWQVHKPETQSPSITADPQLLDKIVIHLLDNALKYSAVESPINWDLTYQPTTVSLQIRDRGIGIPPNDQAHLFESFHRSENVGTIQGTGLGLAIVKNCVDLHQGQITVDSTEQIGTTMTVELPLALPGDQPDHA